MKVIDATLDDSPNIDAIRSLVELRIRNLQCFRELDFFCRNQKFKGLHPVVIHTRQFEELSKLWIIDRDEFYRRHYCCKNNIRRYRGRISQKGIPDNVVTKDTILLEKYRSLDGVFNTVINATINGNK
ncbi:MAG: hypothetical protein RR277_00965 [Rikenellaceae bacterium]